MFGETNPDKFMIELAENTIFFKLKQSIKNFDVGLRYYFFFSKANSPRGANSSAAS